MRYWARPPPATRRGQWTQTTKRHWRSSSTVEIVWPKCSSWRDSNETGTQPKLGARRWRSEATPFAHGPGCRDSQDRFEACSFAIGGVALFGRVLSSGWGSFSLGHAFYFPKPARTRPDAVSIAASNSPSCTAVFIKSSVGKSSLWLAISMANLPLPSSNRRAP